MSRKSSIVTALIGMLVMMTLAGTCVAAGNVKQEMWLTVDTTDLDTAIAVEIGRAHV